jgi:F-type H+-transporting ATPase subunit b
MPQFDVTLFPTQLVWLTITFVVLYLVVAKLAAPRIAGVLEERQERVTSDLDVAANLKQEAETVLAEYEAALAQARDHARSVLKEAAAAAARTAAEEQEKLLGELSAQARAAEQRIADAQRQAMDNVRSIASEVAEAASGRLLEGQVDSARLDAAVDAALKERS